MSSLTPVWPGPPSGMRFAMEDMVEELREIDERIMTGTALGLAVGHGSGVMPEGS